MTDKIKMTILDQDKILTTSLKRLSDMGELGRFEVVNIHEDPNICLGQLKNDQSMLVFDLNTKNMEWEKFMEMAGDASPNVQQIVLTKYAEPSLVKKAFVKGARAYISKSESLDGFLAGLESALRGEVYYSENVSPSPRLYKDLILSNMKKSGGMKDNFEVKKQLTEREKEVLQGFVNTLTGNQIADKLYISEQTVAVHKKNIMKKLEVNNTVGLIRLALEKNLV